MYFQASRIKSLKKIFFNVWSGKKCVLMHFLTTRIKYLNRYFSTSGRVMMHFLATTIKSLKKIFFNVWSGYKRVLMHFQATRVSPYKRYFSSSEVVKNVFWYMSRPPESSLKKYIFLQLEWVKTCFDAFAHTSRQPESSS